MQRFFQLLLSLLCGFAFCIAEDDIIFATKGSNKCPDNYSKITSSKWACVAAMGIGDPTLTGDQDAETFNEIENEASFPSGCYECPKNTQECLKGSWFNEHETGKGHEDARLYCARTALSLDSPENGVIFMGDSDIDYWYNSRQILPGSFNYGVGGYTCKQVLSDFDSLTNYVQNIQWMVLVCGENDLAYGASVKEAFKRFRKIYNAAKSKNIKIIMIGTKPEPSTRNLHAKYRKYDRKIINFARNEAEKSDSPSLIFIDSYKSFTSLGNPRSLYADDKLHLSNEGYKYWGDWLQNAYKNASCEVGNAICNCYVWKKKSCVKSLD